MTKLTRPFCVFRDPKADGGFALIPVFSQTRESLRAEIDNRVGKGATAVTVIAGSADQAIEDGAYAITRGEAILMQDPAQMRRQQAQMASGDLGHKPLRFGSRAAVQAP